jgi:hypothetical protein
MSIRDKWQTLSRLKHPQRFDPARPPFQDFVVLFKYRNDQVHDKVVEYDGADAGKRYGGKLPDGVIVPLGLRHALFAARTYWAMVQEVHRLTGVAQADFHRHYNLAPWRSEVRVHEIEETARRFQILTD